jgi:hypothetical protein
MSRNIVALAALAVAGLALIVPDPSFARSGGMRSGFHGALRAPVIIPRHRHIGTSRPVFRPNPVQFRPLVAPHRPLIAPRLTPALARTTVRAPFARLSRRSHGAYVYGSNYGSTYPITSNDEGAYYGMPYDPGTPIPVYGPAPTAAEQADPAQPASTPRFSGVREEDQEACRSERVTVPAAEGEREITVVRC